MNGTIKITDPVVPSNIKRKSSPSASLGDLDFLPLEILHTISLRNAGSSHFGQDHWDLPARNSRRRISTTVPRSGEACFSHDGCAWTDKTTWPLHCSYSPRYASLRGLRILWPLRPLFVPAYLPTLLLPVPGHESEHAGDFHRSGPKMLQTFDFTDQVTATHAKSSWQILGLPTNLS